jgi:hypothetical protein
MANKQTKEYRKRQQMTKNVVNEIIAMDPSYDEQMKYKSQKTIELMQSMVWPTVVRGRSKREKGEE